MNKEDMLLLILRRLKKNSNLLIDGLGISEIPHRTASPGNIASYMKLSEVDSMYLPVPVNFIFIEFKLGSQELERWFTKIDHIFEHTRIPHIGETLSPFYKVAIDKAHRHHLHIVSPINYKYLFLTFPLDDENVLWQVDVDMMEVLCTSLVEYLEIEDAYNILILNPNHDIKMQKYGYRIRACKRKFFNLEVLRKRLSDALDKIKRPLYEKHPMTKFTWTLSENTDTVEWSNICLDALNNVEKLYQGKETADILHSKIVQAYAFGMGGHHLVLGEVVCERFNHCTALCFDEQKLRFVEDLESNPDHVHSNETLEHFVKSHGYYELFQKAYLNGDAEEGKTIRGQYEGPDQDLADMLERDVLETSLGIRWDDVAGLTEAKRLLEEIVVLPLWMSNIFSFKMAWGSERMVRCLFDLARAYAPNTIFIDEIDYLCNSRGYGPMKILIFGADATHPQPGEDSSPSIAAVVASLDWPETPLKEILQGEWASEALTDHILQACHSIEPNYLPRLTFIVVQKRHHTRLFTTDRNSDGKSGNIMPGTVVDTMICHPTEFDLYLYSHTGIHAVIPASRNDILKQLYPQLFKCSVNFALFKGSYKVKRNICELKGTICYSMVHLHLGFVHYLLFELCMFASVTVVESLMMAIAEIQEYDYGDEEDDGDDCDEYNRDDTPSSDSDVETPHPVLVACLLSGVEKDEEYT
ncbi:hypothetical protein GIB67_035796 [Kingdonia uniflora]|uniref:Piwi domain-containing protein n=1 Tax=Kingdonia uniflora TaxID=39325 RepID=A0A7J7MJH2_9MAGN|nr:hypothetical protein GIB67_035796 [Kingdonia uniflora]